MSGEPQYRASVTKSMLKAAGEKLAPADYDQIIEIWGPAAMQAVEQAVVTEWLPAEHQLRFDQATHDVLGPARFEEFHADFVVYSAPRLLGAFLKGVTNIFSEGSRTLVRALPKAWTFVTRGLGHVETRNVEGAQLPTVEVAYVELPECCRTETFCRVTRAGQIGTVRLINEGRGRVETDAETIAEGRVAHRVVFLTE